MYLLIKDILFQAETHFHFLTPNQAKEGRIMAENIFRQRALENPDKPVIYMANSDRVVTEIELEDRANQVARLLRSLGLKPGDHIALMMENCPEFIIICLAAFRSGIFFTPISTHLKKDEIEFIVNNSSAKTLFTSNAMAGIANEVLNLTSHLTARYMINGAIDGYDSLEDVLTEHSTDPIPDQTLGNFMFYSSGTTGRPKGIKVEYEEVAYGELPEDFVRNIDLFGLNEDAVYLSPAPLYHSAPLAFAVWTIFGGGVVVIMEKFNALEAIQLIEEYKITVGQWVPTMFVRMLKLPKEERLKYDVSSQKIAIHGAAPIPVQIKEQMIDWWGPILLEYYGGTESGVRTFINSDDWLTHKGSVGKAVSGSVKILDEAHNEAPVGQDGTIYFEGGTSFEYHNDPGKTEKAHTSQGWSTVSDVGYLDEEGYLYLTDRATNMIISGGVNIYPQESENLLVTHPAVLDAAVIGIPHEEFGEEVKGVIQLKEPAQASNELVRELIDFCESQLSKIKCPKSIDFVDELPRTPTGKLLKRLLKEKYWAEGRRI